MTAFINVIVFYCYINCNCFLLIVTLPIIYIYTVIAIKCPSFGNYAHTRRNAFRITNFAGVSQHNASALKRNGATRAKFVISMRRQFLPCLCERDSEAAYMGTP